MLFKADDGVGDVRGFQGGDFLGGQLHVDRSDCIVEMMQLGGTDDRCGDDWFRQEPGERDLCPRYPARLGDFGDPVGDLPIGFVGFGEEPAEGLVGLRADVGDPTSLNIANLTWDSIKRLRDIVRMKIMLKGILTREDAILAADNGIDGIIVSNHGGRVVDSGCGTIEVLPEIIEAVGGRMPVLVDSGFRRGTDIIKALAMGAQAVCIGRPYLWGLGAFGQPGVERVLEILRKETRAAMQQVGVPSIKHLTRDFVRRA